MAGVAGTLTQGSVLTRNQSEEIAGARRRCNKLCRANIRRQTLLSKMLPMDRDAKEHHQTEDSEIDGEVASGNDDPAALSIMADLGRAMKTLQRVIREAKVRS